MYSVWAARLERPEAVASRLVARRNDLEDGDNLAMRMPDRDPVCLADIDRVIGATNHARPGRGDGRRQSEPLPSGSS